MRSSMISVNADKNCFEPLTFVVVSLHLKSFRLTNRLFIPDSAELFEWTDTSSIHIEPFQTWGKELTGVISQSLCGRTLVSDRMQTSTTNQRTVTWWRRHTPPSGVNGRVGQRQRRQDLKVNYDRYMLCCIHTHVFRDHLGFDSVGHVHWSGPCAFEADLNKKIDPKNVETKI